MIRSLLPTKFILLILYFFGSILFVLPLSLSKPSSPSCRFTPTIAMPAKRNLTLSPPPPIALSSPTMNKKLRRLPHVFSKVLELPFDSDTDVSVEDLPNCLKFVVDGGTVGGEVRAHVVKLHPGVTKVVIRRRENNRTQPLMDDLELNLWRFRLPAAARPELAKAVYGGGQLVVTVPKNGWGEMKRCVDYYKGGSFRKDNNHMGSLLVV